MGPWGGSHHGTPLQARRGRESRHRREPRQSLLFSPPLHVDADAALPDELVQRQIRHGVPRPGDESQRPKPDMRFYCFRSCVAPTTVTPTAGEARRETLARSPWKLDGREERERAPR